MGILKTLILDDNNDLTLSGQNIAVSTTKREYVAQTVKARCELVRGEWYRNRALGVPYYQDFLVSNPDREILETILTSEAVAVPYVVDVVGYRDEISADGTTFKANIDLLIEGEENSSATQTITVNLLGNGA